ASLPRNRRHVDLVVTRAERDTAGRPLLAGRLADQRDHLGALDRAQVIDDPFGERLLRTYFGEVVAYEVRDDEPAAVERGSAVERTSEQLQLRELHRLVDVLEDPVD